MFVVLGVLLAPMEHLLPDAHDADATVTERVRLEQSARSSTAVADPHAIPADRGGGPSQPPIHASPVDHCAHGHLLTLACIERAAPGRVTPPDAYDLSSQRLLSVSLPPHQRPPIV